VKYYFLFLGIAFLAGALYSIFHQLKFIKTAKTITGKVIRVKTMNYSAETPTGKSKNIEVAYTDEEGTNKTHTVDNSLLVLTCKAGQPITLSVNKNKVLVQTKVGMYTLPITLTLFGLATLFMFNL
jgi:hypothetical protein